MEVMFRYHQEVLVLQCRTAGQEVGDRQMKSIYVGNISFETTPDQLRELFGRHGNVLSVKLISDRYTGKPRGFAFVEMDDDSAEDAISATDGVEFEGRQLKVNLAKPRGVWRMRRPRH
jgi:RNA recognition motif-containing protein